MCVYPWNKKRAAFEAQFSNFLSNFWLLVLCNGHIIYTQIALIKLLVFQPWLAISKTLDLQVRAMESYGYIAKEVAPKKAKLKAAQDNLATQEASLARAR